jgi:hypothetical protein
MIERTVTDSAGRTWTCTSTAVESLTDSASQGKDVIVSCVTPSVGSPVKLTVGWQWESMASPGFARMITLQSPVPKKK